MLRQVPLRPGAKSVDGHVAPGAQSTLGSEPLKCTEGPAEPRNGHTVRIGPHIASMPRTREGTSCSVDALIEAPAPSGPGTRTAARLWFRVIAWALTCCLIAYLAWLVSRDWASLSRYAVRPEWPWILGACLAFVVNYGLMVEVWRRVLLSLGGVGPFGEFFRVTALSQMGKYMPGKVWTVAGRAALGDRLGCGRGLVLASAAYDTYLGVVSAGLYLALAFVLVRPPYLDKTSAIIPWLVALVPLFLAALHPSLLRPAVRLIFRRSDELPYVPFATLMVICCLHLVRWAGAELSFYLFARGVIGENLAPWRAFVGVTAASQVLGFVALFAPAGLGVREASFCAMLSASIPASAAALLALASRVWLTLMDLAMALAGLAIRSDAGREDPGSAVLQVGVSARG